MNIKIIILFLTFLFTFFAHAFYSNLISGIFWSTYFKKEFLLGISYALAVTFSVYAYMKFKAGHRKGIAGMLGGATLTGVLYFAGCFLLGCCGSPMMAVYSALFGTSIAGFSEPIVLFLTSLSIAFGIFWLERKSRKNCCSGNNINSKKGYLTVTDSLKKAQSELASGMNLAKCRKCDCMKITLNSLYSTISSKSTKSNEEMALQKNIQHWLGQMQPIEYDCLGCKYCYPAEAWKNFSVKHD